MKKSWLLALSVAAMAVTMSPAAFAGPDVIDEPPAGVSPPPTSPASANGVQRASDKVVCKVLPAQTGSRIGQRRVCQTQALWDAQREASRRWTEHQQNRALLFSN